MKFRMKNTILEHTYKIYKRLSPNNPPLWSNTVKNKLERLGYQSKQTILLLSKRPGMVQNLIFMWILSQVQKTLYVITFTTFHFTLNIEVLRLRTLFPIWLKMLSFQFLEGKIEIKWYNFDPLACGDITGGIVAKKYLKHDGKHEHSFALTKGESDESISTLWKAASTLATNTFNILSCSGHILGYNRNWSFVCRNGGKKKTPCTVFHHPDRFLQVWLVVGAWATRVSLGARNFVHHLFLVSPLLIFFSNEAPSSYLHPMMRIIFFVYWINIQ